MAKNKNWSLKDVLDKGVTEVAPGVFQKTVSSIKSEFPNLSKNDIEQVDNLVNNKLNISKKGFKDGVNVFTGNNKLSNEHLSKEDIQSIINYKEPKPTGRPHLEKAQIELYELSNAIFIPGQVPSKKNSVNISCKTGKPVRYPSTQMATYLASSKGAWISNRQKFLDAIKGLEMPYSIEFTFIRKTAQKYDWINPMQTVQDLMQDFGWISGDDVFVILPYPKVAPPDKNNPGVLIRIIKSVKIEYL